MRIKPSRRSGAGVKTWYAYDGLGSVVGEISGSTGNLAKARVYDAYGTVRAEDNATSQSAHKFVGALGHPSEYETGLIYMRARYMDPETGRFISEDSARDGANWFIYANNDPVNQIDRDGRESDAILTVIQVMAEEMGVTQGVQEAIKSAILIMTAGKSIMKQVHIYTELGRADSRMRLILEGNMFLPALHEAMSFMLSHAATTVITIMAIRSAEQTLALYIE